MADDFPSFLQVTPFGAYCTFCSVPLSTEKGISMHARLAHPEVQFKNASIVRTVKQRINLLRRMHAHDLSSFLQRGSLPEESFFCQKCFISFTTSSNYKRHMDGCNNALSNKKSGKIPCFATICGRLGPKTCGISDWSEKPSIVSVATTVSSLSEPTSADSFVMSLCSKVPPALMTTQDEAIVFLEPFVCPDEDVKDLSLIYYPLLGPAFEGTMKQYIIWSSSHENEDETLTKWIEAGKLWLTNYAAGHISNVSGNVRSQLAEFENREIDGVSTGTRTFMLRRGIPRLISELVSALRFFYNFPTSLFDEYKSSEIQNSNLQSMIEMAIVPRILYTAAKEEPKDHGLLPIACRYCLSRGFTLKGETHLIMNECGWFSSRISAMMHLLRAGVCGYLVTLSVKSPAEVLTLQEVGVVRSIQHGRVTNLLAPYVKRLRDLNARKPPVKNNTVNANGDITSGSFTFTKSIWASIIPRLVQLSKNCFDGIFQGNVWSNFLSEPISVSDWVQMDVSVIVDDQQLFLNELLLKKNIESLLAMLQSIGELCLYGLGVGAVRYEEVVRLTTGSCQWHNSYLYFWTESYKQGSMKRNAKPKMIEHRLSLSLSKVFLLIRYAMNSSSSIRADELLPDLPGASMLCLVRDIFDLDYQPLMLNTRHLFTSIGNIILPERCTGNDCFYCAID